jgi:ABC-type antimicrobial peptide transport system permease subunit
MSRKQLKKMIKVEIIASCIVSILMAVIYSMLFIALFSVVLDGGFRLTIKNMIIIASIVLITMYIVSIRIGKRIDKLNIIDEIKYE